MPDDFTHWLFAALGVAVLVGGWVCVAYLAVVEKSRKRRRYVRKVR